MSIVFRKLFSYFVIENNFRRVKIMVMKLLRHSRTQKTRVVMNIILIYYECFYVLKT